MDRFYILLIIGMLIFAVISCVQFINFLKLLPIKPADYEKYKAMQNTIQYKLHKKKWRLIFLSSVLVFPVVFTFILIILQDLLFSFYVGVILTGIYLSIIHRKEIKERKSILNKDNTNKKK